MKDKEVLSWSEYQARVQRIEHTQFLKQTINQNLRNLGEWFFGGGRKRSFFSFFGGALR